MDEQLVSGIVGAVIGAAAAGGIAALLQIRNRRSERNWGAATKVAQALGAFLSAYTPDAIKSEEDIWKLLSEWGAIVREVNLLGYRVDSRTDPLNDLLRGYAYTLSAYLKGEINREQVEYKRSVAKGEVASVIEYIRRSRI